MNKNDKNNSGVTTTGESANTWRKRLFQWHFIHHKSHTDRQGIEPRLQRRWGAATVFLNHGAARELSASE